MRKLLGPHVAGQWANKLEIIHKWQPPLITVLQPQVDKVTQLREACPGAIIVGRFYHDDNHYSNNINSRPLEFAEEIHKEIFNHPVTPLLDFVQSNNEVCQDWQGIQKLNQYTQRWMWLADELGVYKCAIMAFSVGNPDLPFKPGDPAGFNGRMLYWQQVLPSLNYAQQNNHILWMHAYGFPHMFAPSADWYIYRYERQVQANLRTLGITNLKYGYGEQGIDRYITGEKGGYKSVPTSDQDYVNQQLQWERDLQGEDLLLGGTIFTFGDSGGWDSYDITSTAVASMIADHYVSNAGDYNSPDTPDNQDYDVFIPAVGTGGTTAPPPTPQPERSIDPRAVARGVRIETPPIVAGESYWFVHEIKWYDEQEADALGPDHHIMIDATIDGQRAADYLALVSWPDGHHPVPIETKPGEPYGGNFPMTPGEFDVKMFTGMISEKVTGIEMGAATPSGWNAGIHTSTGVRFEKRIMGLPSTPPLPAPDGPIVIVSAAAGANIRSGPGLAHAVVGAEPLGAILPVVGRNADSLWWQVQMSSISGGWVANVVVETHNVEGVSVTSTETPIADPEPTPGDNWQRSIAFVLLHEGGYQNNPNDIGNWTGCAVGKGENKGTNFGISACSYPDLDIQNLSQAEAIAIYQRDYWVPSGASVLSWPLCLIVMDAAVLHGVGAAQAWLNEVGPNPYQFAAKRLRVYTGSSNWLNFGKGWVNRVADLLIEASQ